MRIIFIKYKTNIKINYLTILYIITQPTLHPKLKISLIVIFTGILYVLI